jgi:hypothetical protein
MAIARAWIPVMSAMLEHVCYIWLGQGGEKDLPFDDKRARCASHDLGQDRLWRP